MTSPPQDEPGAASKGRTIGWRLREFGNGRQRAWERVRELEEEAASDRDFGATASRLGRLVEAAKAGDVEGMYSAQKEAEQARAEQQAAVTEARKARRRAMLRYELPDALMGLAAIGAIVTINLLWLGAMGVDYVGLYLQDGFQVALLFGVVTVAINLDRYLGLIAAQPSVYVAAILSLISELSATLGNLFQRPRSDRELADDALTWLTLRSRLRTLDFAITELFVLVFAAAMLAWILLVAPLQYFVTLVCGAPSREAVASSGTLWVLSSSSGTEYLLGTTAPSDYEKSELKKEGERGEMSQVSFAKNPVAFTQAITAAFLFGVSRFV